MSSSASPARYHSTCPHDCPSTCALEVERIDEHTIGRVYGADNPYTAGVVCAKVARYAERVHHPDRLSTPLLRRNGKRGEAGEFESVSWDSALDRVAEKFSAIIEKFGSEALWPYHYAGTMGLVQRDGLDRLRNCLGTSQQHSTFCITLADAGWLAGTGSKRGSDPRTICDSELIVVWGGNPVHTQVNLMHHIGAARKKGARLVVVDPYVTATAKQADMHLMPRPGTDGALACAVMHVLLAEGYEDRDYLARHTDFSDRFRQHIAERTPQWAEAITGIDADDIIAFARLYGTTAKSFIRAGYGFTRSRNGAVAMHAVTCLPAITGAWKNRSGGALYSNAAIYHIDASIIDAHERRNPSARVLDQSRIGDILLGDPAALGNGPPIMGMFMQNTNPAVVAPESHKVCKGLGRADLFLCVHEQFMTDTARFADVVLPATMFLEHDDIYKAGGHTYLQVAKKVIEPYAECRSNHQVLSSLAERLGIDHPGFKLSEWELIEQTLARSNYPSADALHDKHWHDCALDFDNANFLNGFGTPDKKFHFSPDWARVGDSFDGLPEFPDHHNVIENATAEYPYRLVAAPARQFLNTTFTETPGSLKREGRPTLKVHSADLHSLGLVDGQRIRLRSRQGEITVHAASFDGLQTGWRVSGPTARMRMVLV